MPSEPQDRERAEQIGRIVQEEIAALLDEHGFNYTGGETTAKVVANMVQLAIIEKVEAARREADELRLETIFLLRVFKELLWREINQTTHCPSSDSPVHRCERLLAALEKE